MTDMKDRVTAFEAKYANDAEILFKIEARACKLFGVWIAENILNLDDDAANTYGQTLVSENLKSPGFEDVMDYVRQDLEKHGVAFDNAELYNQFSIALADAEEQITQG